MTVSALTYAELESATATRADIVVGTGRWTTAKLQAIINRSLKKWNLLMVDAGDDTNLRIQRVTTSTSAVIGANGWQPRQFVAAPDSCLVIRGIDVYPTGSQRPVSMRTYDEAERNDATFRGDWWLSANVGMPLMYRQGGTQPDATNIIQIYPWANAVYTLDIRYLPAFPTALASTSYDFILGGEEFVILDAAMQLLVTDGRAGTAEFLAGMREERDKVKDEALADLSRRAAFHKRDTWLERRLARNAWRRGT